MPDLILRPSTHVPNKPWALQLRFHESLGETEYYTITRVSEDMARDIVAAGKPHFLFGHPDEQPNANPRRPHIRWLTRAEAHLAYGLLIAHCGAKKSPDEVYAFVHYITKQSQKNADAEYRFSGSLGWGGKFRIDSGHNGLPYVDCYGEHLTHEREQTIEIVNTTLAELFGPGHQPTA